MTTDIYDQHRAAFRNVSAFIIMDGTGERVATIALRFPRDGLRLWAYVHLIGVEMVRASAGGGGYDKASAAVAGAIDKIPEYDRDVVGADGYGPWVMASRKAFQEACRRMDRSGWIRELERAGFRVFQAV